LAVDLSRGVVALVRTTGALFAFEARQTAQLAGVRLVTIALSLTFLVSGVMLTIVALALWVGAAMGETWMGFAIVGGSTIACGGGVMAWAVHSLSTRDDLRFPETRGQLGRDLKWLDQQLGSSDKQSSGD